MHSGIALPLSILKANGWNPKSEGLEDDGPFQFMGDVQIVVMFVFFWAMWFLAKVSPS